MTPRLALGPVLLAAVLAAAPAGPAFAQNEMSFTADEAEAGESLFDRVDTAREGAAGGDAMSFDEAAVAEHDALACAAGLGCDGLAVSQDDALVLTGHNTADAAREAYQTQYGNPASKEGTSTDAEGGTPTPAGDEARDGESLFDRVDAAPDSEAGGQGMSFDETAIAEQDALACAAGLGCEGLAVSQDDALVLTGHDTAKTAQEAYKKQYGDPGSSAGEPAQGEDPSADADKGDMSFTEEETTEDRDPMSFSEDEAAKDGESLFDRVDAAPDSEAGSEGMSFDEATVAEQDALACAAGLGCDGLAVSQDDALVLTGHDTAKAAQEAYQKQYGDPDTNAGKPAQGEDLSADADKGDMSFTEEETTEDRDPMSFSEDEVAEGKAEMSFTEGDVQNDQGGTSPGNRFTDAEIASFSPEEDALWACAAGFGCKGAAADLTPHQALYRLGVPKFSYKWPLAACATNTPGACEEMGISLLDAMRIMSHLANPNR